MENMIKVGMADLAVCKYPDALTTLGLGSCVGIALYDPVTKVSGLAHIMLPDSTKIKNNQNIAKFADTGIEELIKQMIKIGASKTRLVAKIAGGAQMFAFKTSTSQANDMMQVGARNVEAVKAVLKKEGIRLLAEDTGLNYGRTIEFYSENGQLLIKRVGKESKTI
ncbi:MAG: chemotaxis protein CheD [Lachnospiraceae bacterium]|uniref:chemotaxis protein CheD n=1 Tax=Falcatimonas sp. MSJ-15 TaxID=2841515 RepID=UPI001C101504|nr:chemotaxis protein CheD [Falcatimonas sp. MSJ-15]MBQ5734307.1 chemotaxis protein CheD [Lachnospiraceae bacterium]MBU5469643.1 chemotaxis protein CheD [Falcatimonas sp. MSJ-15]MEE0960791.1 chemotaxis protein CheD [Lachnospiraceae bacterium]